MPLTPNQPSLASRLRIAAANLLLPTYSAWLLGYFLLRALRLDPGRFVTASSYLLVLLFALAIPMALLAWSHPRRLLRWWLLLPAALFLLNYGPRYLPKSPAPAQQTFTVATYNVLFRNQDYQRVVETIESLDADIVALQEAEEALVAVLEAQLGDRYPYREQVPWQVILSRYPILEHQEFTMLGSTGLPAQRVLIEVQGRPVVVYNVHPRMPGLLAYPIPAIGRGILIGIDNHDNLAELDYLSRRLRQEKGPLIMLGDLNMVDQQLEYASFRGDLIDAYLAGGWGLGLTFTRTRWLPIPIWRIDYVMHSPDLRTVAARLGPFGGSDHRPVVATLTFEP